MKLKIIFAAIFLFLAGCGQNQTTQSDKPTTALPDIASPSQPLTATTMTKEKITFQTSDGVTIVGDWTAGSNAKKAVLLLHMMPAAKESFAPLSEALNKQGFATLAIDLRGHGESVNQNGKKINYESFSDRDHQAGRLDVDAAMDFLKGKGFAEKDVSIVGASIGANLALDAMTRYSGISRGVALSPGLDYRGVKTESALKNLIAQQKVWLVASENDKYSADSVLKLQQMRSDITTMSVFEGGDHGTDIFKSQTLLISDIVKFLES